MLATSITTLLIPLWIVLGLLVLLALLGLVGRIQNGRYLRPLFQLMSKVPLLRRWLEKASTAAINRTNPELASAMRKMQRHGKNLTDPQRVQVAMSQLTAQERRALLEMQDQQGGVPPEATNREMRRRLEKARKRR